MFFFSCSDYNLNYDAINPQWHYPSEKLEIIYKFEIRQRKIKAKKKTTTTITDTILKLESRELISYIVDLTDLFVFSGVHKDKKGQVD